jgi:hypothetical protein
MKPFSLLFSLIVLTTLIQAQSVSKATPAKISGRIIGGTPSQDSLKIVFLDTDINGIIGQHNTHMVTDADGRFEFVSPPLQRPARIYLVLYGYASKYSNNHNALYNYIIMPGDNIHIDITRNETELIYHFTGKGAAKFTCKKEIDQSLETIDSLKQLRSPQEIGLWNWRQNLRYLDSVLHVQKKIISKFRKDISAQTYTLMMADVTGEVKQWTEVPLFIPEHFTAHRAYFTAQYQQALRSKIDTAHADLLALSPTYVNYIFYRTVVEQFVESNYDTRIQVYPIRYGLKNLYHRLKTEYRGALRDMLLMRLLADVAIAVDDDEYQYCLADARRTITTPHIKEIVNKWSDRKAKGSQVMDYTFEDTSGKTVHLSDFKGKIICIDVGFSACAGCTKLAKDFEENLYPQFKNDTSVVFLIISGDSDRNTWLQTVRNQPYRSLNTINLRTNGLAFDHPFTKNYDFIGGPYLLLIDSNFTILSATPPRDGKEMAELIKRYLSKDRLSAR